MFSVKTFSLARLRSKSAKSANIADKKQLTASKLEQMLKIPAQKMSGLAAVKTRYRPYICPLDLVLSEIPVGTRHYDIGCGSGNLLYLSLQLRGAEVAHGYDISMPAVKATSAFNVDPQRFKVALLDPQDTPPNLRGYDTITMIDVLHHLPVKQQNRFIYETVEKMQPGARLILKDIEAAYVLGAFCNQIHDLILAREWVYHRRSRDILKMLRVAGLKIESVAHRWTLWYPHFQIVATKPD